MGQTVHQVEARIARARGRLADDLHDLEAKVESATNWKAHYRRSPYPWLGAAFAIGFVLAGPNGRGTGRVARALKAQTGTETFDRFVGALTTLAVDQAKTYIDGRVPGFSAAFDRGQL